jgi:hypothetical protein
MYLLTNSEGEPYLRLSGLPAVYKTMEEVEKVVEHEKLVEWGTKEVSEEEAARMIQVAYAAGR